MVCLGQGREEMEEPEQEEKAHRRPARGTPLAMAGEIGVLAELTNTLLQTVHKSTLPVGRRSGTGADVQALIRRILDQNQRVKEAEDEMREHQARQAVLRSKAREVVKAEQSLANFVNQFGDIEARLSRILHSVAVRRPESPTLDSEPAGDHRAKDCLSSSLMLPRMPHFFI